MHLRFIKYIKPSSASGYPFNISLLQNFDRLDFKTPVTIFVGENGTGKSTLLEGIAAGVGSITIGEDFISYAKKITEMKIELEEELREVDNTYKERSNLAKSLAKMPYENSLNGLKEKYGKGLETKSHGESFLELFNSRFVPNGLYILDEPEAPLSPMKQLAFISMIKEMVKQNAQFIIATHSPILMAIPGATIISFDEYPIREVDYNNLEHVNITRDFLNNPEQYLRHL